MIMLKTLLKPSRINAAELRLTRSQMDFFLEKDIFADSSIMNKAATHIDSIKLASTRVDFMDQL